MSKSKIIVLILITLLLIGGIIFSYFSSYRNVTIDIKESPVDLFLASDVDNKLQSITTDTTLSLRDGYYCVKPIDIKFNSSLKCTTVYKTDTKIMADFDYSDEYLNKLLEPQQADINSVIKDSYKETIGNYNICNGKLYEKGKWYGAILVQKKAHPSDSIDYYRVVLQKDNNKWIISAKPSIVLSKYDYKNIPVNILSQVNNLKVCAT